MPLLAYDDFVKARANMWAHQESFPNLYVIIADQFVFNLAAEACGPMYPGLNIPEPWVALHMSHGCMQKLVSGVLTYEECVEHIKLEASDPPTLPKEFEELMEDFHV
jgi:hypothetical protein